MPNTFETLNETETLFRALNAAIDELAAKGRVDNFYDSLKAAWARYGSLTERQEAALRRSLANFAARKAERRAEAATVTEPMPSGRVVVTGEVLSVQWRASQYGGAYKMLLKSDAGWKVWGTVPASLTTGSGCPIKGARITFTAKVEPKEATFGFFSRPTNARVLALAPAPAAQPEAQAAQAVVEDELCEAQRHDNHPEDVKRPFLASLAAKAWDTDSMN